MKRITTIIIVSLMISTYLFTKSNIINADDSRQIIGDVYEMDKKSDFIVESSSEHKRSDDISFQYGTFFINGNIINEDSVNEIPFYSLNGNASVSFYYYLNKTSASDEVTKWHLTDCSEKSVNTIKLDSRVKSGAIIIQSSKNGTDWITESTITDLKNNLPSNGFLYSTKDIQLTNGTYFRIYVAYELEIKTGENQILFIKTDNTETKRIVEVYEFYLYDVNSSEIAIENQKKITLGSDSLRKQAKNSGYSKDEDIDKNDPHYAWQIGEFNITGYTATTKKDNQLIILKNAGDELVLWFSLDHDINKLNGNDKLTVAEDTDGYYKEYQIEPFNMKHGTLLIRKKLDDNKWGNPEIYSDFLAASATTTADTKVKLFEEGDYEVVLLYEIKDARSLITTYNDYKIHFSFSIRNGNCMIFPFDIKSNAELRNENFTPNGFRLDTAKSKYLEITVERSEIIKGINGYTEDVRFNRPAKDGDEYSDPGIYTFTIKNIYTGSIVSKKIYVGDEAYIKALAVNDISVQELNNRISDGQILHDDGTLEIVNDNISDTSQNNTTDVTIENNIVVKNNNYSIYIVVALLSLCLFIIVLAKKRRAK